MHALTHYSLHTHTHTHFKVKKFKGQQHNKKQSESPVKVKPEANKSGDAKGILMHLVPLQTVYDCLKTWNADKSLQRGGYYDNATGWSTTFLSGKILDSIVREDDFKVWFKTNRGKFRLKKDKKTHKLHAIMLWGKAMMEEATGLTIQKETLRESFLYLFEVFQRIFLKRQPLKTRKKSVRPNGETTSTAPRSINLVKEHEGKTSKAASAVKKPLKRQRQDKKLKPTSSKRNRAPSRTGNHLPSVASLPELVQALKAQPAVVIPAVSKTKSKGKTSRSNEARKQTNEAGTKDAGGPRKRKSTEDIVVPAKRSRQGCRSTKKTGQIIPEIIYKNNVEGCLYCVPYSFANAVRYLEKHYNTPSLKSLHTKIVQHADIFSNPQNYHDKELTDDLVMKYPALLELTSKKQVGNNMCLGVGTFAAEKVLSTFAHTNQCRVRNIKPKQFDALRIDESYKNNIFLVRLFTKPCTTGRLLHKGYDTKHAVCLCDGWIFDSNMDYALPLTQDNLNKCCRLGVEDQSIQFSHASFVRRVELPVKK